MHDSEIGEKVILPYCKTTEISNRLARMSHQNENCTAVVESIGADLGAGVLDELEELGVNTLQYNPAGAPRERDKYVNMRAEAWDTAARALCEGILPQSNSLLTMASSYTTLESQLCVPTYKFKAAQMFVEAKEDIKKRLGRSPDHADAYIIALWAWPQIRTSREHSKAREDIAALAAQYASPFSVR